MRVLIVDDNAINRTLLRVTLRSGGHETVEAADGVEALEKLRSEKFDAVISDILMPRMDGYRLCYEVRRDPKLRDLPIVIHSSTYTSPADEKLALSIGADRFLRRPASYTTLLETLEELAREDGRRRDAAPIHLDVEVLKEYSERLVRKLEDKTLALEVAKEQLQKVNAKLSDSEERLLLLLDSTAEGIYGLDLEGNFTFCNAACIALLGYRRAEDLVGRPAHASIHHTRADGTASPVEECGIYRTLEENRGNHSDDDLLWRADGSSFHAEYWSYPLRRGGELVGAVVTFLDITDRKRAEIALRESVARQSAVIEATLDALITMDHKGNVIEFNPAAERILGFSRQEVLGKPLADLIIPPDLRDRHRQGLARYLSTGEAAILGRRLKLPALRKDGTLISSELTITRIPVEGPPIFTGFLRDITDRERAEAEIRESGERFRQSEERFRSAFSSSPVAMSLSDAKTGLMADVNELLVRTLGYSREELIGRNAFEMGLWVSAAERAGVAADVEASVPIREREIQLRTKTGETRHVLGSIQPLRFGEERVFLSAFQDVTERRRAEEALRGSEERYRLLFDANPQPMWVFDDRTLEFLAVNEAACQHYGYSREEFLGMTIADIRPAEDVPAVRQLVETEPREYQESGVWRHQRKNGSAIEVEIRSNPIDFGGRPAQLVLSQDVTERRQLEQQLRQAQKMEAIGQLAGGVAHDFNNLLTAILGYSDLLATEVGEQSPMLESIDEIRKAGERAASLTRQLLAFSRRQVLEPKVLDLNGLIGNLEKMLRRLIGEDVELLTVLGPAIGRVQADAGQIEQVILNLAVNARDAMPKGGTLTIETQDVELDEAYARTHVTVRTGSYVMLAVTDTGEGMNAETKSHMFEPFFTTKPHGQGTGLGLATIYGIVKQSGGYVWVYSEVGRGTAVKVYLPRVAADLEVRKTEIAKAPAGGAETVLLVEDEESVRALIRRLLAGNGYTVLEAGGAKEALEIARRHSGPIHLLLTDVVMPETSGSDLAAGIVALRPEARVIFMSGYTDDAVVRHGLVGEGLNFLQKPFTPETLAHKVREVLDAAESP